MSNGWKPWSSVMKYGPSQPPADVQSFPTGHFTTIHWLMPEVGVLPLKNVTYTVPSGPTMGSEPWSWSQAFGLDSALNAVQDAETPLISSGADHVAPPLLDWLKKMGLSKDPGIPVDVQPTAAPARKIVHVS